MRKIVLPLVALASMVATPTHAAYVINFQEFGNDVVASGQGSLNIGALTNDGSGGPGAISVRSAAGQAGVGSGFYNVFSGASAPGGFNLTNIFVSAEPDITTGAIVGTSASLIVLPVGYASGSSLGHSTAGFYGQSFASMNMKAGSYTWSWGSGANADSLTINIGGVPEPTTWAMMIFGFGLVGAAMRRRRSQRLGYGRA